MCYDGRFKRGMVVLAELKGGENLQSGIRPCVVIQNNIGNKYSPTLIIVPFTTQLKKINMTTHVVVENEHLRKVSMALAEQIVTINKDDVIKYLFTLDEETMKKVDKAVENSLHINDDNNNFKDKIAEEKAEDIKELDTTINVLKKLEKTITDLTQIRVIKIMELMKYCNSRSLNIEEYYPTLA